MLFSVVFIGINILDDYVILYVYGLECGMYVLNIVWLIGICEWIYVYFYFEIYCSNLIIILILL